MPRWIKVEETTGGYRVLREYTYYSPRYDKRLTIKAGSFSNGANWVPDPMGTDAWVIHDYICNKENWPDGVPRWDDGTQIVNWDASMVLKDVSQRDGYSAFATVAFWATYFFGCRVAKRITKTKEDVS